ncbi:MAG TPA: tRNA (adenosine(37)-N6)-threonylcarbamoyltransferase complex ATPase subunit type 1 TsaE [Gammaproteobacteria bacterium]|jgi:tRNA threonylcarbamoyladenosine biosynthesis protein TsaE|nr:tRNA (adenosine(37)-N6)-threonylcarbamoyltransferase complex ATPase subunit type 1 TsaE [Gammaproteobacteria bacterium]
MNDHSAKISRQAASEAETQQLAADLVRAIKSGAIIYLYGTLGAGKTTFVRGMLRGLGFTGRVKSPTYTIVEPYETDKFDVFHFDLYRLDDANELRQIGLETYFDGKSVCLIEWPEKGSPILPSPDLVCYFDIIENGRKIRFESFTNKGKEILTLL